MYSLLYIVEKIYLPPNETIKIRIFAVNIEGLTMNIYLSDLTIVLLAIVLLSALAIVFIYCPFVRRIASRRRKCQLIVDSGDEAEWPAASVVVYSRNEFDCLEGFLRTLLTQDYPGSFEVIVVNEGDSQEMRNLIAAMQLANRNLYLTFTPEGAHNLSRKKLALTLGIKAARYDTVVLTTVDASICSDKWLTKMMRHFKNDSTGIVLGFAAPQEKVGRCASFAFAANSVDWLSAAIGKHPYRGTELNLAYRRKLFFDNKGFSRSLNLHFGDDDIFISEIARADNTVVELSPESIVRFNSYDNVKTMHDTAMRHLFTERFIRHKPFSRAALGETALWTGILSSVGAVVLNPMNVLVISVCAALLILDFVEIARSWRKTTAALELRRLTLTASWFVLVRPIARFKLRLRASISKQKKYTWD